jgi:hypothetical protein
MVMSGVISFGYCAKLQPVRHLIAQRQPMSAREAELAEIRILPCAVITLFSLTRVI